MKIEAGKRYVRRDGKISGVIKVHNNEFYPRFDPRYFIHYTENGMYWKDGKDSRYDLIAEYVPKSPTIAEGGDMGTGSTEWKLSVPEPLQAQEAANERDALLRRSMLIVAWARGQCHPATCGEEVIIVDECDALMAEYSKTL